MQVDGGSQLLKAGRSRNQRADNGTFFSPNGQLIIIIASDLRKVSYPINSLKKFRRFSADLSAKLGVEFVSFSMNPSEL